MATRSRVSRSKSPKRAASRSRSASKKSMRRRSASKKSMRRKSVRRSRSASRKSMRKSMRKSVRKMTKKSPMARRANAYANFRKMNWKKVQVSMPGASFAQLSRAIAAMWKKAGSKTKSAVRKMLRSPRKVRKMRMSKKRALKKSGSPRRARKDKGKKRAGGKLSEYQMFIKKYFEAKKAALGGNAKATQVMKSLGHDWKQGVRNY